MTRPRGLCVAVAEDDDDQRMSLERLLTSSGFDVLSFEDGDELFDYFALPGARRADVIVADLNMPGRSGLTGLEFARAKGINVPIFVVTGAVTQEARQRVAKLSNALLLSKPVDPEKLTVALLHIAAIASV
jgi:DNA-binding response OmpR family regulator